MDEASGFFESPYEAQRPEEGTFELIGGGPESYCNLWRANKEGRFRVYKALKSEYVGDSVYERLIRKEFEIGYSLNHPNICEYYGFLSIPRLGNCIEMEWIDGRSLDILLSKEVTDKTLAAKIINETCDALAYMHSKQVVHRDLKPSNIMLTYNGNNVKIIDFGLSDSDAHSVLKGSAGTQVYASPELLEGGGVDFHTDIFSLGLVIDRLSPSYANVVRKCCRRDPMKRFQSANEVKQAIAGKSRVSLLASAIVVAALGFAATQALMPHRGNGDRMIPMNDDIGVSTGKDSAVIQASGTAETVPAREIDSVTTGAGAYSKGSEKKVIPASSAARPPKSSSGDIRNQSQKKESHSDQEAIDELFRQATELFDR